MKSLSKKYLGKLLIGEVRATETALLQQFGISKFPTLLVVTDSENYQGELYPGEHKVDQLTKFLDNYAY